MTNFFDTIDFDDAEHMQQLSRLMFEFRISRDRLLQQYAVADTLSLLEKIRSGELAEHPAYDHYLSLRVLEEMYANVRAELKEFLPKAKAI